MAVVVQAEVWRGALALGSADLLGRTARFPIMLVLRRHPIRGPPPPPCHVLPPMDVRPPRPTDPERDPRLQPPPPYPAGELPRRSPPQPAPPLPTPPPTTREVWLMLLMSVGVLQMLEKPLWSSSMHHTRIVVPREAVAVLIAWFNSTFHSQRLLEVISQGLHRPETKILSSPGR